MQKRGLHFALGVFASCTCLEIVQAVGCLLHDALKIIQTTLSGPA